MDTWPSCSRLAPLQLSSLSVTADSKVGLFFTVAASVSSSSSSPLNRVVTTCTCRGEEEAIWSPLNINHCIQSEREEEEEERTHTLHSWAEESEPVPCSSREVRGTRLWARFLKEILTLS